jgi:chromosome segregation ATPase
VTLRANGRTPSLVSQLRYRQVLALTEKLNEYDGAMRALDSRRELLARDNDELHEHIEALEEHFALLDANRKLAVAELETVQHARLEAARAYHDKYAPPTKRVIRWYRGLKKKWLETKKSKPKGKK